MGVICNVDGVRQLSRQSLMFCESAIAETSALISFNAPKSANNSSACVSEISSGFSSQRNFRKSSTPAALSVSTTSARSSRLISGNSCGGRCVFLPRPEPHANARRGAARAARALVGVRLRDLFNQQRVDAAVGVVAGNARQAAINHQPHAVNRERRFGDVGGDDDLALVVTRHRGVLLARRQFAVQRQQNVTLRLRRVADGFDRLGNFKSARHEHQHVALAAGTDVIAERFGRLFPDRALVVVTRLRGVSDFDGKYIHWVISEICFHCR